MYLTLDFETRSPVDLKTCGAQVYAAHPGTSILCLAWAVDDDAPFLWLPGRDSVSDLAAALAAADTITAYNSDFERLIWQYHGEEAGLPPLPVEKLRCSAAKAAMHGLPRSLGDLCAALNLPAELQKDGAGFGLIKRHCCPVAPKKDEWAAMETQFSHIPLWAAAKAAYAKAKTGKLRAYLNVLLADWPAVLPGMILYNDDPAGLADLYRYCLQDVVAEREVSRRMSRLSTASLASWRHDRVVNDRGLRIDQNGARAAIRMVEEHSARLLKELAHLTSGKIKTAKQTEALGLWCASRGVDMPNMQKATVSAFLRQGLPDDVRRVLEIRASLNKASTAKYAAALCASSVDDKVRGWAVWHGAATGRWTSNLVQVHNLPRGTVKGLKTDEGLDAAFAAMACGPEFVQEIWGADPMALASSALRGLIVADPGHEFLCADFSSVEARGLAWLAGDEDALDVFRSGRDPYKVAAAGICGKPYEQVDKNWRQIGKVSELALGYNGGIGAYASMARNYDIDLETLPPFVLPLATEHELEQAERTATTYLENLEIRIKHKIGKASEMDRMTLHAAMACDIIKQRWRVARPVTVAMWAALEDAARAAVSNPGQVFTAGRVAYKVKGEYLRCLLPSGRVLFYYKPHFKKVMQFGKRVDGLFYWGVKAVEGRPSMYAEIQTYSGKLAENITQAVCNCLLREALLRVEAAGYPIVLHVHDEIVAHMPVGSADLDQFCALVAETPAWAVGFPMGASGWRGRRYKKD